MRGKGNAVGAQLLMRCSLKPRDAQEFKLGRIQQTLDGTAGLPVEIDGLRGDLLDA